MLVAIVTIPNRPAWATISASRSWELGVQHHVLYTPLRCRIVRQHLRLLGSKWYPTSTGCLFSFSLAISSATCKVLFLRRAEHHVQDFPAYASA